MHYPGKYSNDGRQNSEIHKDKAVINQAAGNIEFINTKDSESVSITHKNGTFIKFDKFGSEILTTRDKRENVIGDSLLNINGTHIETIDENKEEVTLGDVIEKVGDIDKWMSPMEKIKESQRELHDLKRLFELKRTDKHNDIDQAPEQKKVGKNKTYAGVTSKVLVSTTNTEFKKTAKNSGEIIEIKDGKESYNDVSSAGKRCFTCWGKLLSPSTQDGTFDAEELKDKIFRTRERIQIEMMEYEAQLGQNKHPEGGSYIRTIAKNFVDNIGLVFNDFESFRKDPKGKLVPYGVKIDPLGSTIYTQFRETSLVENVDVEKLPGGTYELNVCDGWTATVGSNGINFKTTGPLNIYGTLVNMMGEQITINSRNETSISGERVDISGEVISIRPRKISREIDKKTSTQEEQQVLIDGNLNVSLNAIIRGGAHIEGELSVQHITAPCEYHMTETNFSFGEALEPQTLPNSDPALCAGGKSGVRQLMEPGDDTPRSPTYATLLPGAYLGKAVGRDSLGEPICLDVYSERSENFAIVDPHVHPFKAIASRLVDSNVNMITQSGSISAMATTTPHDTVRSIGARNNWPSPVMAQPVVNSQTPSTVAHKFIYKPETKGEAKIVKAITIKNPTGPRIFDGDYEYIRILKTDWERAASTDDVRPAGEGVGTSKYSDMELKKKMQEIELTLEARYAEIKSALADLSSLKDQIA